jgi:hypothetical protein
MMNDECGVRGTKVLPMASPARKSLMRSLGEFCGHIARGIRTDPSKPGPRVVRKEVEEETRETPQGRMTLRRTTIEEVEVAPPPEPPKT